MKVVVAFELADRDDRPATADRRGAGRRSDEVDALEDRDPARVRPGADGDRVAVARGVEGGLDLGEAAGLRAVDTERGGVRRLRGGTGSCHADHCDYDR